jgi:hypothetical protein
MDQIRATVSMASGAGESFVTTTMSPTPRTAAVEEVSGMPAARIETSTAPPHQVGDRVQVRHRGRMTPGRIRSVHPLDGGVEYVISTDPVEGGMGHVVNVWTTSGRSHYLGLAPATAGGETR